MTTATSIHPAVSVLGKYHRVEGLASFINYAIVYFLVVQVVDRPARMRSLLRTLFFSGAIVAAYGIMQYLGIEPVTYGALPFEANRSFASYGNPDILGGFLMFSLPLSIALALSEERPAWRAVYWVGSILNAVVWVTAFTRSAWVGGVVAIGVLVFAAVRQRVRVKPLDYGMAGASAAAAALVVVRSLSAESQVMNALARVRSIFEFGEGSALTRFQIWGAAWRAVLDRPIFGFGLDTFRLVFPVYKPAEYVRIAGYLSTEDNAHNYPLQVATAIGIPGLLLLYGMFVWVLAATARSAFSKASGGSRLLYAGVWASVAGYLAHLMFGLSVAGTSIFLWLFVGLLLSPRAREVEVRAPRSVATIPAVTVIALVALALLAGNVRYVAADRQHMLSKVGTLSAAQEVEAAKRAVELNPYNNIYRSEVGLAYLAWASERLATEPANPQTDAEILELLKRAEAAFDETIAFVPAEYDNYVYLAGLYNNMARLFDPAYYREAERVALLGIELSRYGPGIRAEHARALDGMGRTDEAIKELEFALSLDPANGPAAVQLAEILARGGDLDAAIEVLEGVTVTQRDASSVNSALESLVASRDAQLAPVAQ